ncbi:MAG: SecY interacting protein Syd [Candidatus Azotimanducaceae bacterium]|jgi:SecY interacting protein Syd
MQALDHFIERMLLLSDTELLTSPYDPDWRSPCEQYQDKDLTFWRPETQSSPVTFSGLAHALELDIHPDITRYYSAYWSGALQATSDEGPVSLIQLWNDEDFERLIANLIGHAMAKQKKKQAFTVFFANTEPDSEMFLSIDNTSGAVLLEEAGKAPLREVESDISTFLERLKPDLRQPDLY